MVNTKKKGNLAFGLLVLTLLLGIPLGAASMAPDSWQLVAPGVEFQVFHVAGPNMVYVARLDRAAPNMTLDSTLGRGRLASGVETVLGMSNRYDQAINFWGQMWGGRNRVAVAINGSFAEDVSRLHTPASGQIQTGWYAKRFDDNGGGSGFAWKLDGGAHIGECVNHQPDRQFITLVKTGDVFLLDGINKSRKANQLILYTPQYDSYTNNNDKGAEVVVEMTRPALVLPRPARVTGYVRDIRTGAGSGTTAIPFDHVVLSTHGTAMTALLQDLAVGDEVGITQEITSYEDDCKTLRSISWTNTYASISGHPIFLKDGVIQTSTNPQYTTRDPRTAIAFNNQYIYFIVVDGRHPGISEGMTLAELAGFTRNTLGADWGINQDGGGSSTMVVNGIVVNNTYCNNSKCLDSSSSSNTPDDREDRESLEGTGPSPVETWVLPDPDVAAQAPQNNTIYLPQINRIPLTLRGVANGMLMVVVDSPAFSTRFAPGDEVITSGTAHLRLGPGTNYAVLATIGIANRGTVLGHLNGLDGIQAKGTYWWKVNFGTLSGWMQEESLIVLTSTEPSGFQKNFAR